MNGNILEDAKKFKEAIALVVREEVRRMTRDCFRVKKAKVTTAPDGTVCGVTLVGDGTELFLPYVSSLASVPVGSVVWVAIFGGDSMRNAVVWQDATVDSSGGSGGEIPSYHAVTLNSDGTVQSYAPTLIYNDVLANLSNPLRSDYLDVTWRNTKILAKCMEVTNSTGGDLKFIGECEHDGIQRYMVFTLNTSSVLATTNINTFEDTSNKVQDIAANATSTLRFPSTKAVFDQFQRKPVTVWEVDGTVVTTGLVALETDMTANPNWQLTGLDMTPFKRIKVYTKAAQKSGSTASASTTPSDVLEISLDPRAAGPYGGHYIASNVIQKPNDRNRFSTLCCAVSADKTSFAVLRMTNLYGTAATDNSDVGAYVFKIEGYYD